MQYPRVLHITCDYPDAVRAEKTRAVSNLVAKATDLQHTIFSLNRNNNAFGWCRTGNIYSITYPSPPFGIFQKRSLINTAKRLESLIDFDFDIIHAHKFSVEGVIAALIARSYHKPLLTTVRGHSDLTIMGAKPHYRKLYRHTADTVSHFFFLAPWTRVPFQKKLDYKIKSLSYLPNITSTIKTSEPTISNKFITTINYKSFNHRSKNIKTVLYAFKKLISNPKYKKNYLEIYTYPELIPQKIKNFINSDSLHGRVIIKKIVNNKKFVSELSNCIAFIRPSYPETFGMVYIESLKSGTPVLHACHTAIDGYLNNYPFIKSVPYSSISETKDALIDLIENQKKYKRMIHEHLKKNTFNIFSTDAIISSYQDQVNNILYN